MRAEGYPRLADVVDQPGEQLAPAQPRRATLAGTVLREDRLQSRRGQHPLKISKKRVSIHRLSPKSTAPQINSLTALALDLHGAPADSGAVFAPNAQTGFYASGFCSVRSFPLSPSIARRCVLGRQTRDGHLVLQLQVAYLRLR